jgi:hypothetical protein
MRDILYSIPNQTFYIFFIFLRMRDIYIPNQTFYILFLFLRMRDILYSIPNQTFYILCDDFLIRFIVFNLTCVCYMLHVPCSILLFFT